MWPALRARSPSPLRGGCRASAAGWGRRDHADPRPHPCARRRGTAAPSDEHPHPHPRRHHPRGARQVRAAGATCRLARCARRDRALGAAEARHRRAAHRRVGAACEDRGGRARRQGAGRDRAAVADTRAALRRIVRLDRRARREARQPRSGAIPAGDAEPRHRGTGLFPRSTRRTSPPNGNGTASVCRRQPPSRTAGASRGFIRAPARTFPARFPI